MSESEITEKQQAVLDKLPASRRDVAESLDITVRSCRYRMDALEEKGYDFWMDSDDVWHEGDRESVEREDDEPWRVNTYNRAQTTKDVHNELTEMEQEIKEALSNVTPNVSDFERSPSSSTLIMPHSDSHVGAIVEERHGVDYYSAEEARDAIEQYFDECIRSAQERGDVEDVVLILNGDHLDGEGVHAAQRHEQEDNLRDQLRKAAETYIEQILRLSEEFENVSVYCVPGNHGDISKRSTSNADMMLFDYVDTSLSYSDAENINLVKAGPGGFVNFTVRGWNYFSRHGEDYLEHVGTSSGIRRALQWHTQYQFDAALRSHYHSVKYEPIADEVPIVMTGSPAPPSTFAESKAADGGNCGVYWFTTEDQVIDGFQPIRINN